MKSKILSLILTAALLLCQVFVMPISAADTEIATGVFTDDATGFTYKAFSDNTAEITGYDSSRLLNDDSSDRKVEIPEIIGGGVHRNGPGRECI